VMHGYSKHTATILRRAAQLVEDAPKLAKGAFAVSAWQLDAEGLPHHEGPSAVMGGDPGEIFRTCYCTSGAIRAINTFNGTAPRALADYLGLEYAKEVFGEQVVVYESAVQAAIFRWNDAPERTKAEVVTALRGAADQVEGKVAS
jgi:hypothetical protein